MLYLWSLNPFGFFMLPWRGGAMHDFEFEVGNT